MKPTLTALNGPLRGRQWTLEDDSISIGRDTSNQISLNDNLVSRRHCLVRCENDHISLVDLDSLNGTFVNNRPIKKRTLCNGDRIDVGETTMVFLSGEAVDINEQPIELDQSSFQAQSTIRLAQREAVYLNPDRLAEDLPTNSQVVQDLSILLKASLEIHSLQTQEALCNRILELLLENMPADQGAVLLLGRSASEFQDNYVKRKDPTSENTFRISRSITQQVLNEGTGLLIPQISRWENASDSLLSGNAASLLCVPLSARNEILGVIYLDSRDSSFEEHHLELLTALSNIASLSLEEIRRADWLKEVNRRLLEEIGLKHEMIGESPVMLKLYDVIARVAGNDSTVLVAGESGTGKELVARAIHNGSRRSEQPFVAINCSALTETLLESELFGHEKGAFTGAYAQREGKLEAAEGGTVFLDEIGDMTPVLQAKILRVLQERELQRVGGSKNIRLDVRFIAATNKDLNEAVKNGSFREDLFYRLNVICISVPPLRERKEDIPLLTNYFLMKFSHKTKKRILGISPEARAYLFHHEWPGNIRELENAVEHAVVMAMGERIEADNLPQTLLEKEPPAGVKGTRYQEAVLTAKKQAILNALQEAGGSFVEAAKLLGVQRTYLHRIARNLRIK